MKRLSLVRSALSCVLALAVPMTSMAQFGIYQQTLGPAGLAIDIAIQNSLAQSISNIGQTEVAADSTADRIFLVGLGAAGAGLGVATAALITGTIASSFSGGASIAVVQFSEKVLIGSLAASLAVSLATLIGVVAFTLIPRSAQAGTVSQHLMSSREGITMLVDLTRTNPTYVAQLAQQDPKFREFVLTLGQAAGQVVASQNQPTN